jgi:hypothetical protein
MMRALLAWLARRRRPSEFAAGIARSLIFDTAAWAYSASESSLISEKAELRIGLYDLKVRTTKRINSGTEIIATFVGIDRRVFRKALTFWKRATAAERSEVAEKRKRDALLDLGAPRP